MGPSKCLFFFFFNKGTFVSAAKYSNYSINFFLLHILLGKELCSVVLGQWHKAIEYKWCEKQRHYIANKSPSSQGYGFPVVMYGCERWTVKKAEHQRIDAFELWCWKRLLRVPWTARRSILKEISPGISLEGMMLKLKLQYFGHVMRRVDSLEKTLMLGGIGGRRRGERQRMRWLDGRKSEWTPGDGDGQGGLACCDSWGRKESDTTERLNWKLNWSLFGCLLTIWMLFTLGSISVRKIGTSPWV